MESLRSLLPFPLPRMSRRQRNLLLACCAIGAGGYVSYRIYNSPILTRKRLQLYRFFHSLTSLLESAAQGSDCVGVLWKDLHSFLLSNEDEVPQSLKQLFKVGQTREFQTSVALLCKSVTQGVVRSLSEQQAPFLQDGADYGSALFEEPSSQKGLRKFGKSGGDSRRERRRKESSGEASVPKLKDAGEDNSGHEYRRGNLEQGESASLIEGEEGERLVREQDEDEAERRPAGSGARAGASISETSGSGGSGNSRCPIQRTERVERTEEGLSERLVGKIFSEAGRGFASVVVASATRSLVLSVLEGMQEMNRGDVNLLGETILRTVGWEARDSQPNERENDGVSSEGTIKKPMASPASSGTFQDGMINFICSSKGKSLIADCIETFVGTAVSVYLDKTRDINIYEEILNTVSSPAHRDSVKDLLTSVCNGALETLIRASHEVLTVGSSSSAPEQSEAEESTQFGPGTGRDIRRLTFSLGKSSCFNQLDHSDGGGSGECGNSERGNDHFGPGSPPPWSPDSHDSESLSLSGLRSTRIAFDHSPQSEKKMPLNDPDKAEAPLLLSSSFRQINGKPVVFPAKSSEILPGWIEGVSRTLAVPSNRALVLDVAGTVTAEAVRSTIDVMVSKVSHTLRGKAEKGSAAERSPGPSKVLRVINKTGELAQATASKALVAMTMCLAICLHTLLGQSKVLEHP